MNEVIEDSKELLSLINTYSHPMEPIPTDIMPVIKNIKGIRAIIFDVYGTLFISGSGDIGSTKGLEKVSIMAKAFESAEIVYNSYKAVAKGLKFFIMAIEREHKKARKRGIEYPEVDILKIWEYVLNRLKDDGLIKNSIDNNIIRKLAISYELAINPVWPMPGLSNILAKLQEKNLLLGIVSNAQFYTPLILEQLLNSTLLDLGFNEQLIVWSYMHLEAKPSLNLFRVLFQHLEERHAFYPHEVIYIGNDMLNDILPANQMGFLTALFAGDKRSIRLRPDHDLCKKISPDIIITELNQILDILDG